ncbi:MAG: flagellum-specific ATP synthase FliI [Pseudomonadota bacterium]
MDIGHQRNKSKLFNVWGTVTDIEPGKIQIQGVSEFARVGSEISIQAGSTTIFGEVQSISDHCVSALIYSDYGSLRLGDRAFVVEEPYVDVGSHWLGNVVDYRGRILSGVALDHSGAISCPLYCSPPLASQRRPLGFRLPTGLMATDTLLPICRGQRVGLFAGSGVGKSTLLGRLAEGISADRVVIGLIGERSREVSDFIAKLSSQNIISKTTIVAATASESPGAKKRAAYCAVAAAEYFRDRGHHTLLILDSLTRFAEAHREIALMGGETPALNAFPPSTMRVIAELVERAGPGIDPFGDITAIFSVLVAGSDMEEPLADMIRGILDGHIILNRQIAERGRYPAIDILRSVSRALPEAANAEENSKISDFKKCIALREEIAPMLRANLYEIGSDSSTDRAIALYDELDDFAGSENKNGPEEAFEVLNTLLSATNS